ncbi:hypothetical protein C8A00DRAFT_16080 [Chaetomidium leptoderma]|uniref:Uncharacterized protein n=1 Tax=Chaetomidium leptoderma TaxID=669021 RepID=A0AAN6ZUP4_9PEZI|nr:hypothetical protein C8A00DRAFT_16080 [Chaetomidium leptoderma]
MNETLNERLRNARRRPGPPDFSCFTPRPRPPPIRRPPGPLKLGPHYRVPTEIPYPIHFRFRTRIVYASATSIHHLHPNVVRLRLQPSIAQQIVQLLVRRLPFSIQAWFESFFPEWSLPSQLILKKQKKGWDEEFEAEKAAYTKLLPLQGVVIPRCFGQLRYDNARALLLSDIGGACLAEPDGALLEVPDFRRLLLQALTALAQFRVLPDDIKLDNFQLTGDKIMALDLETLRQGPEMTDEQLATDIGGMMETLTRLYEGNQYGFWEDGLIMIDN